MTNNQIKSFFKNLICFEKLSRTLRHMPLLFLYIYLIAQRYWDSQDKEPISYEIQCLFVTKKWFCEIPDNWTYCANLQGMGFQMLSESQALRRRSIVWRPNRDKPQNLFFLLLFVNNGNAPCTQKSHDIFYLLVFLTTNKRQNSVRSRYLIYQDPDI